MVRYSRCTVPAKKGLSNKGGSSNLTIIIPCAGCGARIKSYGSKSLININEGGTSILERQLHLFKRCYPNADIIVIIGYQEEKIRKKIKDKNIRYIYNPIFETTNVAYSIGLGLRSCITTQLLIVYGDLIFNKYAIQSIVKDQSSIVIDVNSQFKNEEVGVSIHDKKVLNFAYGLPVKWAQIVFLTNKELEYFKDFVYNSEYKNYFGYEILNKILDIGGSFRVCQPTKMKILEIDCVNDLKQIGERFNG